MSSVLVCRSASTHAETARRLVEAVERRGLKVFARVDHAAAARDVALELADEEVVLFGDPRAGTPLMASDPRIGIELPLRILVWLDADGTALGYNDPSELANRYDIGPHRQTLEMMSMLLAELAAEAAG